MQKIYRSQLLELMPRVEKYERVGLAFLDVRMLMEEKQAKCSMISGAKSVLSVEVENILMTTTVKPSGLITSANYRSNPDQQPREEIEMRRWALSDEAARLLRVYQSPFCSKAEKLCALISIISNRNIRKLFETQHSVRALRELQNSKDEDCFPDSEGAPVRTQEPESYSDGQSKVGSTDPEEVTKSSDTGKQLPSDKEHEDICYEDEPTQSGKKSDGKTSTIEEKLSSSDDRTEAKRFNSTEGAKFPDTSEEPKKSSDDIPELGDLQRVFTPPLNRAQMVSALSRVFRWREQLLSKSHEKHRAQEYKQILEEAFHDFKHDSLSEDTSNERFNNIYYGRKVEHSDSRVRDLIVKDIILSGSAEEATEVHVCKPDNNHETFRYGQWLSGDKRTYMPIWCTRKWLLPTEVGKSATTYELSPAEPFKQASDVDFMLVLGPVASFNGPPQSDSSPIQSDSNLLQSDSKPLQSGSNELESDTTPIQSDSKPLQSGSNELQSDSNPLQSDHNPLQSDSNPLQSGSNPLHSDSNPLQSDSNALQSDTTPIQSDSSQLQNDFNPLQSDSSPLQRDSDPPQSDSNPRQNISNPLQSDSFPPQKDSHSPQSDSNPLHSDSNPLHSDSNPLQSDTTPIQSDSNQRQSDYNPPQSDYNPPQSDSNPVPMQNGCQSQNNNEKGYNPIQEADGFISQQDNDSEKPSNPDPSLLDSESNSKMDSTASIELDDLTLSVNDADVPGFVHLRSVVQRNGQWSVKDTINFVFIKAEIEAVFRGAAMLPGMSKGGGPAVPIVIEGDNTDLVPCFRYPEWDSIEFRTRERPSGRPSQELVDKLCRMPIHLVYASHGSSIHTLTWRKSFSCQESAVIRSMTKPQRICLVMLKHCAAVTRSSLASHHLKTAMMWVCERRPPDLWTWEGMLDSMEEVLDFLQECMECLVLPCYFCPEVNLWHREKSGHRKPMLVGGEQELGRYAVVTLRVHMPRAIQLLLAGLLSSSQAPLMRHLLGLPLDAQQFLWCCWKRSVDDPTPDAGVCTLYPHAVEGRLWSERFLDTFSWEKLPARCKEPTWFAEHGLDTDSEGDEDSVDI